MINSSIVALPHTDHAKTTLFGNGTRSTMQSMHNFKAPESLYRSIKDFWEKNHDNATPEQWVSVKPHK